MKYKVHNESRKTVPIIQHKIWKLWTAHAARIVGMQQVATYYNFKARCLGLLLLGRQKSGWKDVRTDVTQIR
jgi:hypothetical protein